MKRSTSARLDGSDKAVDGTATVQLGAPALDTMALHVSRLPEGVATTPMQTTANNIYAVIDGEGESIIDGTSFSWARGDVFVAPAWRKHHHRARTAAHLLRVTDEPVLKRFNWFKALS